MKDYLDDLLVWAIIIALLAPVVLALARRRRTLIIIVGVLVFLAAVPAAFMSELSINGCCGAPSTGYEGVGYLIGGFLAVVGILLVVFSDRLAKH